MERICRQRAESTKIINMAKWRKTISLEEYNETMKPNEELSWGDTVPFEAVRTPKRTEWVA